MPQEKALLPIQVHKKKNSIEDINIFDESLTILRASIIIRWRKGMAQAFFGRVFIGFNFLCLGTVRNIILSHYSPSLKNQLGKWIRSYLWKAFLGRAQRDTLAYYPKKDHVRSTVQITAIDGPSDSQMFLQRLRYSHLTKVQGTTWTERYGEALWCGAKSIEK